MFKKKSSSAEKKRKYSQSEERHDNSKRRSTESNLEQDSKDELADPELDRIGSDIEEGGLDLNLPFQPITAYVTDKREMLEQCFHSLGEKKLRKMLPDELKEQVFPGPLVNGVSMPGGEEVAVYLCVQVSRASVPAPAPQDLRSRSDIPLRFKRMSARPTILARLNSINRAKMDHWLLVTQCIRMTLGIP